MTDAELCREKGWKVGTVLEGRRTASMWAWADTRIRITAIGEDEVLARRIATNSSASIAPSIATGPETTWGLQDREWREVEEEASPDPIVEAVVAKLRARSAKGITKYGTTLDRDDLSTRDWIVHAQEEALDLANYLEAMLRKVDRELVRELGRITL